MFRKNNGAGKKFAIGALLGTIAGGVTALLFAPKPGKELRKDISKKSKECCDHAKDAVDSLCCEAEKLADKAKKLAKDAKDAFKD